MKEKGYFFEMMAVNEECLPIGHFFIRYMDKSMKIARFGFVIIDDTMRKKGYGREMLTLAIKYVFEILKAEKITIGVFKNNVYAHKLYLDIGFKEVSKNSYNIKGEEWDCIELEMKK